ncbi:MAG: glycosyltransferase family 39 protein [Cyanobacteria bacterium]|nr:glycosyltransferase family 39 protein [Cyanobacteriota bacterium]
MRFYQIDTRNGFGWDQVDNAWAAKKIIVDHNFPLLGMVARGNSGIYIGPAYYYLISIFYWFTNLDPIASGIFAGLTSIFTFFTIFFVIKKLFSFNMALIAVFINTISFFAIMFDRTQWPDYLIPAVSLIIFYCLYQILLCKPRYLIFLAIALGFSFSFFNFPCINIIKI